MRKSGNKLHPIFKLFTYDQVDYIQRAARMIRWPVNISDATIHIQHDAVMSDVEELTIRHLESEFGFELVYDIQVVPVNTIFNPAMGIGPGKQVDLVECIQEIKLPNRGDVYNNQMNERLYVAKVTEKQVYITYLNSMKVGKFFTHQEWYDANHTLEVR